MNVTISFHNGNPDTIFNVLARELGREPTNAECKERIFAIMERARAERIAAK